MGSPIPNHCHLHSKGLVKKTNQFIASYFEACLVILLETNPYFTPTPITNPIDIPKCQLVCWKWHYAIRNPTFVITLFNFSLECVWSLWELWLEFEPLEREILSMKSSSLCPSLYKFIQMGCRLYTLFLAQKILPCFQDVKCTKGCILVILLSKILSATAEHLTLIFCDWIKQNELFFNPVQ